MKGAALKLAALLLLFVLPLFVRLAPIEHGLPRNYIPDTNIARAALSMARDKNFVPPAGTYTNYPNLLPYMLLPVYAAEYAIGKTTGAWKDSSEFGTHMLEHPEDAQLPARYLIAILGALTPWIVFRTARAAGMTKGAWVAAWLVATGLLHAHFSMQERPWVPMTFFLTLAVWPAVLYVRDGRGKHLLLSGFAAALSFSAHQGGLAALAIPALAWVLGPLGWKGSAIGSRLKQGVACVAGFAVLALVAGHLHYLVHGRTQTQNVIGGDTIAAEGGIEIGGMSFLPQLRFASFVHLSRALFGYDPVLVVLGLLGLWAALKQRTLRVPVIFLLGWALIFMANQSDHVRYLLPLAVFLAWPAGLLAERWMTTRMSTFALGVVLCLPLVQVLRLDHLMAREDTRALCEDKLEALPDDALVALDRYGPEVELDKQSIYRLGTLRESRHEKLRSREQHRKDLFDHAKLEPRDGANAVRVEELFEIDERRGTITVRKGLEALGSDGASVLKSLHVTHFLRVERRMAGDEPELLGALVKGRTPVWVIDPSAGKERTHEALLPTEMEYPLVGLWSVERPGPWLALYALE